MAGKKKDKKVQIRLSEEEFAKLEAISRCENKTKTRIFLEFLVKKFEENEQYCDFL